MCKTCSAREDKHLFKTSDLGNMKKWLLIVLSHLNCNKVAASFLHLLLCLQSVICPLLVLSLIYLVHCNSVVPTVKIDDNR